MSTVVIERPPKDDDELWELIATLWGFEIPRRRVCPGHRAPFEAVADAYFARSPVTVWKASRGFGGKTRSLGVLSLTEVVTLACGATILGGSGQQSVNVHEAMDEGWSWRLAPRGLWVSEPTKTQTKLKNGGWVRALMASQRSVRGPHPQRLRLDEIDEMDLEILEAAQGQPMRGRSRTETQTVMSSTHQNPDGTMTEILRRAGDRGWPVYEWCYRENLTSNGGWLDDDEVERKKAEIAQHMWDTEYELQEPSFEGRAIVTEKVEEAFREELGVAEGKPGEYLEFEEPQPGAQYITGVDWAKEKDWTVIRTFRVDCTPAREVAFERLARLPWPVMINRVMVRRQRYPGAVGHDALGVGNVAGDVANFLSEVDNFAQDVKLVGQRRYEAFTKYIAAIESGDVVFPRVTFSYNEHKYCLVDDLYGSGHPPDSFIAGAIAWYMRTVGQLTGLPAGLGVGSVTKESYWRR